MSDASSPRMMSSSSVGGAAAGGANRPLSPSTSTRFAGGRQGPTTSQRSQTNGGRSTNVAFNSQTSNNAQRLTQLSDTIAQTPPVARRQRRELGQRQRPLADLSSVIAQRQQAVSDNNVSQSHNDVLIDPTSDRQAMMSQTNDARMLDTQSQSQAGAGVEGAGGVQNQVWGTDIDIQHIDSDILHFFETFVESTSLNNTTEQEPYYLRLIRDSQLLAHDYINLNCQHLKQHASSAHLYRHLITYPSEIIGRMDAAAHLLLMRLMEEQSRDEGEPFDAARYEQTTLFIRPYNLNVTHNMRSLNPEDIDSLVAIKGMVIRVNAILPEMLRAFFECSQCRHVAYASIDDGQIQEPQQCGGICRSKYTYQLIHNRCQFEDRQVIKLQETPDSIPEGQTPHSVKIAVYDSMVDTVKPGDRVCVTGIYKATSTRLTQSKMTQSTLYKTHLDGLHIQTLQSNPKAVAVSSDADAGEMQVDSSAGVSSSDDNTLTSQRRAELDALGHEASIYSRLVASLAPSVYDMDDVKRGILCQLFGGTHSESGARSGQFRGEINILMCGDPGTSKSQLLSYVNKIAPRGIYTSGKGSSAVGLTASVTRDVESRELQLESGALVLSDRGICCIDEFDKMNETTRSILHEVMEQQTVSIAKSGIVCSLNARTSILASANPKQSRYNPSLSVVENIQIMPTLLSRFDLIYLILDQVNDVKDRRLAHHLVQMYWSDDERRAAKAARATPESERLIDMSTLKEYIAYARQVCKPVLSSDAQSLLIDNYLRLRRIGQSASNKVVTATPRQLEALIRLSEALARMRLSSIVQASDVHEASRLMDVATQTAATDPRTGCIDMDLLTTGHSSRDRKTHELLLDAVRDAVQQQSRATFQVSSLLPSINDAATKAGEQKVTIDQLKDCLRQLDVEGVVKYAGNSNNRNNDVVRRV